MRGRSLRILAISGVCGLLACGGKSAVDAGSGCTGNASCPAGQVCLSGGSCGPCTNSGQCGSGMTCVSGACTAGMACSSNAQCPNQVCSGGVCANCTSNTQCPNQVCLSTGGCGPCTTNAECDGQLCNNGVCMMPSSCTSNSQCGSNAVCLSNGTCGPCSNSGQCLGGLVCLSAGGCGPCSASAPCPGSDICLNSVCVSQTVCSVNANCPANQVCLPSFHCGSCTTNTECPMGEVCLTSGANAGGCGACSSNDQCLPGAVCQDGGVCGPCQNDVYCTGGQICELGGPDAGACGPCAMTSQCPGAEVCLSGACGACTGGGQCINTQSCQLDGGCGFGPANPMITIDGVTVNGTLYVGRSVTLTLGANNAATMSVFLQGGSAPFVAYATGAIFDYTGSDGLITLCVVYEDASGNVSDPVCATATADVTPPTVPTGLTVTGITRNATATWTASTDSASGVAGYNVYYGTSTAYDGTQALQGPSPFLVAGTASAITGVPFGGVTTDVAVTALDRVGNESAKTAAGAFTSGTPWTWLAPTWGPGDGISLQCFDVNTCMVLSEAFTLGNGEGNGVSASYPGNRGGLSKTANGGQSWTLLDYGSGQAPLVLRMRDVNVGLLSTTEVDLVRLTNDGGKTWKAISLPPPVAGQHGQVTDIRWIDPVHRPTDVLLYVYPTSASGQVYLYLSTDTGLTFTSQGATNVAATPGFVFVQDPTRGAERIVLVPPGASAVYASTSAGSFTNFTSTLNGQSIWDATFESPTNGVLVGASDVAYYDDAGTWTQGMTSACAPLGTNLYHLAYGFGASPIGYASAEGIFCDSLNGGLAWTALPFGYTKANTNTGSYINAVSFVNVDAGFLEVDDNGWPTLVKTADRGQTWTRMQTNFNESNYAPNSQGSPNLHAMYWFDENHGWVGDNSGGAYGPAFFSTINGGTSWTDITLALEDGGGTGSPCASAAGFVFPANVAAGFAFGPNALCTTANGGASWTVEQGAGSPNLYATANAWTINRVFSPDPSDVYAVGVVAGPTPVAHAAWAADAGTVFTQLPSLTNVTFTSVGFGTPSGTGKPTLYAGAAGLTLYNSVFSGGSWGAWLNLPSLNTVSGWAAGGAVNIDFVIFPTGKDTGYVFSKSHADVLKTTNAAATWTKVGVTVAGTAIMTANVTSVGCEDDSNCTVLDAQGEIWTTTDGFATVQEATLNASGFPAGGNVLQIFDGGLQFLGANQGVVKTHSRWQ